jgi:GNAT superfamily N-acetyltransferase
VTGVPTARRAGPRDAEAIIAIFDAVARTSPWLIYVPGQRRPDEIEGALVESASLTTYWVAPADGLPVAALEMAQSGLPALSHTASFGMAVLPSAQRRGFGRALIRASEAWALAHGVCKVSIVCAAGNTPALALYQECGYVLEGRQKRHFRLQGRLVDALVLAHFIREDAHES